MQTDEQEIIDYLKAWTGSFVSGKEIARKVGRKERFDRDHGWAIPILAQMVRLGILESDHLGCFRLKLEAKKKKPRHEHVSPQMLKILKSSGKSFETISIEDESAEAEKPPIPFYPKPVPPAVSPVSPALPTPSAPPVPADESKNLDPGVAPEALSQAGGSVK